MRLQQNLQLTPTKKEPAIKNPLSKLSIYQDLSVCIRSRLTYNQRLTLKKQLIQFGVDIFAPTRPLYELREEIFSRYSYAIKEISTKEGSIISLIFLQNIRFILEHRLNNLNENGRLQLMKFPNNSILLVLLGDKGNKYCKIGIGIGNVAHSNNPSNMVLLAMFKGCFPGIPNFTN